MLRTVSRLGSITRTLHLKNTRSNKMSLTLKTAAKAVEVALKGKLVPIMKGAPGL